MIMSTEAEVRDYPVLYLRHGFPEAFKVFFFEYYPELFSFSQMLLEHRAIARKTTMEAFFQLWNRRLEFDSAKKIKAFLYLFLRNRCIQQLRAPDAGETGVRGEEAACRWGYRQEGAADIEAVSSSLPPELLRELYVFASTTV
jgi:DNA-directed RNA polymerase specialized sigma24 family protein